MTKVAVIIQARTGSSRLPGKTLKPLNGSTVIEQVVGRCRKIRQANEVVCAIPDLEKDAALVAAAERTGVVVVTGSETDVLARYLKAAQAVRARQIMRITSDCPLVDPEVCDALIELHMQSGADYSSNAMPRSYPVGLDCEIFSAEALFEAANSASEKYDREHVTPWMIRAPHLKRSNLHSGNLLLARMRWTLDYPEDLDFVRAVYAALPHGSPGVMKDVLDVLDKHPLIAMINAMHGTPES